MSWGQKVAAYWSISWPALLLGFLVLGSVMGLYPAEDEALERLAVLSVVSQLVFFGVQWFLIRRLTRKKYRSFRIVAARPDGSLTRELSWGESTEVWRKVLVPQLAFVLILSCIGWFLDERIAFETRRALSSLSMWFRFLVVGPYAIGMAMDAIYPKFQLQAYSQLKGSGLAVGQGG